MKSYWTRINPNQAGRARPIENQKHHFSWTESQIDIKPGYKFKFAIEPWRDPWGPFFSKGLLKSTSQGSFQGPFGGYEGHKISPKKIIPKLKGAR